MLWPVVDDLLLLFVKSHLYRFIFLFFFRLLFAEQIFALQVVNLLKSLTSGGFLRYHSYFFSKQTSRVDFMQFLSYIWGSIGGGFIFRSIAPEVYK